MYRPLSRRGTALAASLFCLTGVLTAPAGAAPGTTPPPTEAPVAESQQSTTAYGAPVPDGVSGYTESQPEEYIAPKTDPSSVPAPEKLATVAAAGPIEQALDASARDWGFGNPTTGIIDLGNGYWVKFYQNGTEVYSPGRGAVPMSNEVYRQWWVAGKFHTQMIDGQNLNWGQPLYSTRTASGVQTTFDRGSFVYDGRSQLVRSASRTLTNQDVVVIGDSQVWDYTALGKRDSWVAKGIKANGYNNIMFNCGGVGYLAERDVCPSYSSGVLGNKWDLPVGNPRAIYVQGSGNDIWTGKPYDQTVNTASQLIDKLRQAYPGSQIIITDLLTNYDNPNLRNRGVLGDRYRTLAAQRGVTFISYKWWVSDYNAQQYLADQVHFRNEYQYVLAGPMGDSFGAALRGNTLKGAVGTMHANTGGTAKYGYPLNNETPSVNGGVYQRFAKNYTIYWSANTGAHSVSFNGAIGGKYQSAGYERGYGYPVEEEVPFSYGMRQVFEGPNGPTRVYWSPNTGARAMKGNGAIFKKWVDMGHANTLGFPITDETPTGNGVVQYFRNAQGKEYGIYWSAATGAHVVDSKGALYFYWWRNGYVNGMGFPVTDEALQADGRVHLRFSSGVELTWSAYEGVRRR